MNININIPDLIWNEFTSEHFSISSHVCELRLDYKISYCHEGSGTDKKDWLFYVFKENGKDSTVLLGKELALGNAKSVAEDDYKEIIRKDLSRKAVYFVYNTEHKSARKEVKI